MKKIGLYLVLITAVLCFGRNEAVGEDIGNLEPVQLVIAEQTGGELHLLTDTGHSGTGDTVAEALEDMKDAASGEIFLDTADYLLIRKNARSALGEFCDVLRPSCAVCEMVGRVEPTEAAQYLAYHIPEMTIALYQTGESRLPQLISDEGRMTLVQ